MAKQHSVQVSNLGRKTAIRGRSLVYLTCIRNEERRPGFHSISLDCKGRKLRIILLLKGIGVARPKTINPSGKWLGHKPRKTTT